MCFYELVMAHSLRRFSLLVYFLCRDNSGNTAGLVIFGGADLNDNRNTTCSTPLHLAVMECNVNAVYVVIQGGCDPNLQVSAWYVQTFWENFRLLHVS